MIFHFLSGLTFYIFFVKLIKKFNYTILEDDKNKILKSLIRVYAYDEHMMRNYIREYQSF